MPEIDPQPEPRENQKLKTRVDELERVLKLVLQSVVNLEDDTDCCTLKKGVYLGVTVE